MSGQVTFENVSFQYVADKPLIHNFDLEVKPGEMVAIVGPTGAGKTTLINLLMRFYDVTDGCIKAMVTIFVIYHAKIIANNLEWSYKMLGFMKQVSKKPSFGNLDATDEEIVAAAKAANVDHFIRTLPGGYNMEMNQESSNVSLGQKQLLTIARALLADPKILILMKQLHPLIRGLNS